MSFSHCFFAGIPTESNWSQSYTHGSDGKLFGIALNVGSPVAEPAVTGKEIFSAAMEAAQELERDKFLTVFKKWTRSGVNIAAIFIDGNKALLFAQGDVAINLIRAGNQQTILKGTSSGQFIEGDYQPGDYYVLGTLNYFENFSFEDTEKSPQEHCDLAVAKLHQLPDSSRVTSLFVKVSGEEKPAVAEKVTSAATSQEPQPQKASGAVPYLTRTPSGAQPLQNAKVRKLVKIGAAVITVVLLLFLLSSYLTTRKEQQLAEALKPYRDRYETIKSLPEDKKVDRLQGLRELSRDLTDREKQTKEASLKRAYEQLLVQVNRDFAAASGEIHLEKLNVFYDFRLIAPDFVASAVAYDIPGKLAVFLDGGHSRLLSLSLEKKEALTLSVDEKLTHPLALAVENRRAYVLLRISRRLACGSSRYNKSLFSAA